MNGEVDHVLGVLPEAPDFVEYHALDEIERRTS
jgi:hypothetical protein